MTTATIVLADDEDVLVVALRRLLEEAGYRVIGSAPDGRAALEMVEELEPDVLIIDLRLPEMTGIEVAQALQERMPAVSVIILSGYDDTSLQMVAERIPVAAYLVKGCSSRQIFQAIERAVSPG